MNDRNYRKYSHDFNCLLFKPCKSAGEASQMPNFKSLPCAAINANPQMVSNYITRSVFYDAVTRPFCGSVTMSVFLRCSDATVLWERLPRAQ